MRPLELGSVSYSYEDGTVALKDVSFTLDDGEKLAVIGPNGAGKSTLLQLIAGFRTPFQGSVTIDGQAMTEKNADVLRRRIGLLFQDPDDQLFMPTVREDVAFGPANLKLDDPDGRALLALRSMGVEHLADRRPHRLSHGMKKRVAIAGVLAMDPKVLLLDEPTSGLDPRSRLELLRTLKGMKQSMVIATHDLEAAAEVADKVMVLNVSPVRTGAMSEIVKDVEVLRDAGLEPPQVTRLFAEMERRGLGPEHMPVTVEQAAAQFEAVVEREAKGRRPRR